MLTAQQILALEPAGEDRFLSVHNLDNLTGAVFGGQQLALALAAAQATVADWPVHHLAGQFLARVAVDVPMELAVERTRDGRRFAARRVIVRQDGRAVFDLLCSFNAEEAAPGYGATLPLDVPPPESLPDHRAWLAANAERFPRHLRDIHARPFPVELRMVDAADGAAHVDYWVRMAGAEAIRSTAGQACLLALVSDYWLAGIASAPLRRPGGPAIRSTVAINHAMWFHAPARTEEWLLFRTEGLWSGGARGLAQGRLIARDGRLLATLTQETALLFG